MCLLVVSSIVWIVIICELFKIMWLRRRCREPVSGEVLTYRVFDSFYYKEYYPVVRYAWGRATYTKMSRMGSIFKLYNEGDIVEVWVNPLKGKDWYISDYFYKRVALIYRLIAINITLTLIGFLVFYGKVII